MMIEANGNFAAGNIGRQCSGRPGCTYGCWEKVRPIKTNTSKAIIQRLEASVEKRMMSDAPYGIPLWRHWLLQRR